MQLSQTQLTTINNTSHLATSDRYVQIPTSEIIARFEHNGFTISSMQQANWRKESKAHKVKHLVRMKAPTAAGPLQQEVVIMNSSDSSSSLKLNFGAIRMACLNQLVFGDLLVPELRIRHTNQNPFDLIDQFADTVQSSIQKEIDLRTRMENTRLSFYDIAKLSEFAALLRESTLDQVVDPLDLQSIQRREDNSKDLWTVFNRIQENLIKGNYRKYYEVVDDTNNLKTEIKKTKVLTDKSKLISVNKALHQHCAELIL